MKQQQIIDNTVKWFDKHYSPSKKFRKRELEDSQKYKDAKDSADQFGHKLDMAWSQKYLQNFGNCPGTVVPDRREAQSMNISSSHGFKAFADSASPWRTWHSSSPMSTMSPSLGGSQSFGASQPLSGPSSPTGAAAAQQIPQLKMPANSGPIEAWKNPVAGSSPASSSRPSRDGGTPLAAGMSRATSAPSLGTGSLGKTFPNACNREWATSNMRYGWIQPPPTLAYKPKKKARAEEVVFKELQIINGIDYSPRIRFGTMHDNFQRR